MPDKIIAALIGEGLRDGVTGETHTIPMQSVRIEPGLATHAGELCKGLGIGKKYAVISDVRTYEVLGKAIEVALGNVISIVLPDPKADGDTVARLRTATLHADCLIAVGSGTINDLCKYASFLDHKPYVLFGTAPSMNGYGSANAAITIDGHKKSLAAHLPEALYLDIDILAAAPIRLIRSGLGDTLCRSTSQADWLLSHILLGTPYNELPCTLIAPFEVTLCEYAAQLAQGDRDLIQLLASVLVISGFSMVLARGSYPASQGEHMIAHTMEMVHGDKISPSFHGEQIGVTTLTMAALQRKMLEQKPVLTRRPIDRQAIVGYFGQQTGAQCIKEMEEKYLSLGEIDKINNHLSENWSVMARRLSAVMLPEATLRSALAHAGSPLEASALGWKEKDYVEAARHAIYSRNRFTFLDLEWYSHASKCKNTI